MPTLARYISNQGPDVPGQPVDVRFIASTETYEAALALKNQLDPLEPGRAAVIFRSVSRLSPSMPKASHETWHLDQGTQDSVEAKGFGVVAIGYDVFTADVELIEKAPQNWGASVLCNEITALLQALSQTGDPTGGK